MDGDMMKKYVNGEYVEMTEEEIKELERQGKIYNAYENSRPFTEQEVAQMLLKEQINILDVDDKKAYRMKSFYPLWNDCLNKEVKQGFKFTYNDVLYKVIQPTLTIQEQYVPGIGTESLYEVVDETHEGTLIDPIPYNGNMALENGKYYYRDNMIYLCNRDTEIAVHQKLSELVGIYVEEV